MNPAFIPTQLAESGLCVVPGFLSPDELGALRADLREVREARGFYRAGTGQGRDKGVRDDIRRDEIHWLEREPSTERKPLTEHECSNTARDALWRRLDGVQLAINRALYLGLRDFEGHYAVYPPGGFYKRHLDSFRGDQSRTISFIIYLNEAWQPTDGGELRVYVPATGTAPGPESRETHIDVQPVGGTLVCFLSRDREHEVLTSHAERISFTGWFKQ